MNITELIIQLICGALGGNAAAALMKKYNLGPLLNSILGILGGGLGGQLLGLVGLGGGAAGGLDAGSIVSSVAGGGVGGGVLLAIVGLIKQSMAKK